MSRLGINPVGEKGSVGDNGMDDGGDGLLGLRGYVELVLVRMSLGRAFVLGREGGRGDLLQGRMIEGMRNVV
jgi:hypothetical protein